MVHSTSTETNWPRQSTLVALRAPSTEEILQNDVRKQASKVIRGILVVWFAWVVRNMQGMASVRCIASRGLLEHKTHFSQRLLLNWSACIFLHSLKSTICLICWSGLRTTRGGRTVTKACSQFSCSFPSFVHSFQLLMLEFHLHCGLQLKELD